MGHNYHKLDIWLKSVELSVHVIKQLKNMEVAIWPLRDQIVRSCISIPSNIAEGSERNSKKDFIRFLYIPKASNAELRTQLTILAGVDEKYEPIKNNLLPTLTEIAEITQGLIKKLEKEQDNQ